jgi:hypothetical protein
MKRNNGDRTRLPEFIGIGPARTGTTWLHDALSEVAGLPYGVKETKFFSDYYQKGIGWYSSHFRFCAEDLPVGEICPYFQFSHTIERIHSHIPNCRIICTFRDPVERAYSFYKMMRRIGWARGSFEETLATHPAIAEGNRYAFHLRQWQERFGKPRVLVTLYDDLAAHPQAYLDQVSDFIGARRIELQGKSFRPEAINRAETAPRSHRLAQVAWTTNKMLQGYRAYRLINLLDDRGIWRYCFEGGAPHSRLDADLETRLRKRFRPEVDALETALGRDLSAWKTGTR